MNFKLKLNSQVEVEANIKSKETHLHDQGEGEADGPPESGVGQHHQLPPVRSVSVPGGRKY